MRRTSLGIAFALALALAFAIGGGIARHRRGSVAQRSEVAAAPAVQGPAIPHAWPDPDAGAAPDASAAAASQPERSIATASPAPHPDPLPASRERERSLATATPTPTATATATATPASSSPTSAPTAISTPTATARASGAPPPPAPEALVAEAQGEHAVALRWGASRGAVAYDVQRGSAPLATVRGTRTLDEGLGVGGTYCYTVRALDRAGNPSEPAGPACATTPDLTPPTAPADVVAAADGEHAMTLRWKASTDEVGVTGYEVVREDRVVAGGPTTAAREQGLSAATRYCYRIRAFDAAGNRSAPSDEACADTPDLTPPTTPLHVVARATSDRSVQVAWQASVDNVGVARYEVVRTGDVVGRPAGALFDEAELLPGRRYCYTVTAVDEAGNRSGVSAAACALTPDLTPPTIPGEMAVQPVSSSSIYLAWEPSEDDVAVSGYEVLREDRVVATVAKPDAFATALAPGARHCFRVRAFDQAGNRSGLSRAACARTADPAQPPAPYALRAEPASTRAVNLTWSPSSRPGVVYRVYWEGDKAIGATKLTAFGAIGLKPGEHHCYRVAAVDEDGHESPRTLEACAAPHATSLSSR